MIVPPIVTAASIIRPTRIIRLLLSGLGTWFMAVSAPEMGCAVSVSLCIVFSQYYSKELTAPIVKVSKGRMWNANRDDVNSQLPTDDDLVVRAARGDRAAFAALVSAHYDFLFRTAWKWSGSREDAEDIAQEVCIKLATAISGFDGRSAFTSWLYRIVINSVRDRQRQGSRRTKQVAELKHLTTASIAPGQEEAMTERQVWDAVRQLPDKQRDAVLLVYAEERPHAEVALIMGTKESTVSWYIHEAKKVLRGLL